MKYKNPKSAYKYAKINGCLSNEEEKIFATDLEIAINYAIDIKKSRLSDFVENKVFKYYLSLMKDKSKRFSTVKFIQYLKMTKFIPNKYQKTLLENINYDLLYIYSKVLDQRLPDKYEKKMFKRCQKENNLWPIVEYHHAIKKLPDYMHNFMIAKSIEETNHTSEKNALAAYFLNRKEIINLLYKLYEHFDKEVKLKEIIDNL